MVIVALVLVCVYAGVEVKASGVKELSFVTSNFSLILSYAVFAFEGIGVVLPIMEITENKEQYFPLMTGTLIVICIIFVSYCEFAAFAWGVPQMSPDDPTQ